MIRMLATSAVVIVSGSALAQADPEILKKLFQRPVPEAYLDPVDAEIARTGRGTKDRPSPCSRLVGEGPDQVMQFVPTDRCVKMTAPHRWTGVWRDEFEGSEFCVGATASCEHDPRRERVWLSWKDDRPPSGKSYRVTFMGRRTQYPGMYGHLGVSQHELIVDRMISMREVRRPAS